MSGSSLGSAICVFTNLRVGTTPTWTPPYTKADGQKVGSRLQFVAYKNSKKPKNSAKEARKDRFTIVVWGTLADSIARNIRMGQAFSCVCEPQQYSYDVVGPDGKPVMGKDGTPLKNSKVSFTVKDDWNYGEDSEATIKAEIDAGIRPKYWAVSGDQQQLAWKEACRRRSAPYAWNGQSRTYGIAEVVMPRDGQVDFAGHCQAYGNVLQPVAQPMAAPAPAPAPQQFAQPAPQAFVPQAPMQQFAQGQFAQPQTAQFNPGATTQVLF